MKNDLDMMVAWRDAEDVGSKELLKLLIHPEHVLPIKPEQGSSQSTKLVFT